MIDLDALKAELEQQATNIDGNVMIEVAVVHSIIARHVAPIVTPEPDAEARDVLAEAIGENEGLRYGDHKDVWQHIDDDDKHWLRVVSDAGLAALRARGFAVVRTADVEAARDCARGMALECRGKPKDDYNALADRLQEAIR